MLRQQRDIIRYLGFTVVISLALSACAPSTPLQPTPTVVLATATPAASSTPEATSTPQATSTPTFTPTPAVTATQVPAITPPASGMGNVVGLILWDSQPVADQNVSLCKDYNQFSGCVGKKYYAKTNAEGYFVFQNVVPDQYRLITSMTKIDNNIVYLFYLNPDGSPMHPVPSGGTLTLDPWNVLKLDLHYTAPRNNATVPDGLPTFKWDPYPDAAYYRISIAEDKEHGQLHLKWVLEGQRVDGTEFTPQASLKTCWYDWLVQAFNAQGVEIAESAPKILPLFNTLLYPDFEVASGQGSC